MMGFVNPLSVAKLRHEESSPVVGDLGDCGKELRTSSNRVCVLPCLICRKSFA